MLQAEEKEVPVLVSSLVPCSLTARFLAVKVIGRALTSIVLQLLYSPILSPNEDLLFSMMLPETDKNYLAGTWPTFLQNRNHKAFLQFQKPLSFFVTFYFILEYS